MLLSEAILLGSVSTEQGFGVDSIEQESPRKCALGAALHVVGYAKGHSFHGISQNWPWATRQSAICPVCDNIHKAHGHVVSNVMNAIWILNDCHKWTRPQIAAWVASIEPQESGGQHLDEGSTQVEQVPIPAPCPMVVK
jgi:hypothetical protein